MPLLSRSARPLLKQVDNKQHAKEDDHEENSSPLSSARSLSPPKRKPQPDEDIEREPDSSSEEEEPDKTQWHANRGKPAVRRPQGGYLGNIHSNGHEAGKSTAAQESSALSGQDTARSQDDARMDAMTQSSQASNSGGKRKYGRTGSTGYGKSVKKQRTESDSKSGQHVRFLQTVLFALLNSCRVQEAATGFCITQERSAKVQSTPRCLLCTWFPGYGGQLVTD